MVVAPQGYVALKRYIEPMLMLDGHLQVLFYALPQNSKLLASFN